MNKKTKTLVIIILVIAGILGLGGAYGAYYLSQMEDTTPVPSDAGTEYECGYYYTTSEDTCPAEILSPAEFSQLEGIEAIYFKKGSYNNDEGTCKYLEESSSLKWYSFDEESGELKEGGDLERCTDSVLWEINDKEDRFPSAVNLYVHKDGKILAPPFPRGEKINVSVAFRNYIDNEENVYEYEEFFLNTNFMEEPITANTRVEKDEKDFQVVFNEIELPTDKNSITLEAYAELKSSTIDLLNEGSKVPSEDSNYRNLVRKYYNLQSEEVLACTELDFFTNVGKETHVNVPAELTKVELQLSENVKGSDVDGKKLVLGVKGGNLDEAEYVDGEVSNFDEDQSKVIIQNELLDELKNKIAIAVQDEEETVILTINAKIELDNEKVINCGSKDLSVGDGSLINPDDPEEVFEIATVTTSDETNPPVQINGIELRVENMGSNLADLEISIDQEGELYNAQTNPLLIEQKELAESTVLDDEELDELPELVVTDTEGTEYTLTISMLDINAEIVAQASSEPIIVQSGDEPEDPDEPEQPEDPEEIDVGSLEVSKTGSDCVERVSPNNQADFIITIENTSGSMVRLVDSVKDKLPLGFNYNSNSSEVTLNGQIIDIEPTVSSVGSSQELIWEPEGGFELDTNGTLVIAFTSLAGPQSLSGDNQNEVIVNQSSTQQEARTEYVFTVAQSCTSPQTGLFDSVAVKIIISLLGLMLSLGIWKTKEGYQFAEYFSSNTTFGRGLATGFDKIDLFSKKLFRPREHFEEKIRRHIEDEEEKKD